MSNNSENEGGSIHGGNLSSNKGGSIFGDNNSSNEGGNIGKRHEHDHDEDHERDTPDAGPTPGDPVGGFAETLPTDGVTLAFPVTHNLDTRDTLEQVYNPITGLQLVPGIAAGQFTVIHTSPNVTTFVFVAPAPAPGAVRVVIAGVYNEGS